MLHALKSIILPRKDPAEDLDGGMILGKVHKEPFMRALSSPIISNSQSWKKMLCSGFISPGECSLEVFSSRSVIYFKEKKNIKSIVFVLVMQIGLIK